MIDGGRNDMCKIITSRDSCIKFLLHTQSGNCTTSPCAELTAELTGKTFTAFTS